MIRLYIVITTLLNNRNWDKESTTEIPSLTSALIKTNYKTFISLLFIGILSVS